jgi:hypothetical protein
MVSLDSLLNKGEDEEFNTEMPPFVLIAVSRGRLKEKADIMVE